MSSCHPNMLLFVKNDCLFFLKWETLLSYLRRSTTWSMSVMFNLSLTASISSAAADRTEHGDRGLGERGQNQRRSHVTHTTEFTTLLAGYLVSLTVSLGPNLSL